MNESKFEKSFQSNLASIAKKKGIYVLISSPQKYKLVNALALKYYTSEEKKNGIYVSLNKGYDDVIRNLKEQGTDVSKLYFIDGITRTSDKDKKADNCTFITSPQALTELSLAITTATNTKKFDFLFLDTINTLLIYNDLKTTERFTHYLIAKIRAANVSAILLSLEEESANKLIPIITPFCDDCIDIRDLK
ncbi:MAG: ATPase domain-containing protein [Nanoarchaeota archaeon]